MSKVYLAGPITGLSYGEARLGWRQYFPTLLSENIQCSSPMRGKESLKDVKVLERWAYEANPITTAAGITTRDHNDVYTCDVMVANFLDSTVGSLGTAIEFGWASAYKKPIVTVMLDKNIHDHLMIRQLSGYIVPTLEEAAHIVKLLVTPGV
jgi:nucleoside 2-deoxyribosyltransferase